MHLEGLLGTSERWQTLRARLHERVLARVPHVYSESSASELGSSLVNLSRALEVGWNFQLAVLPALNSFM